jgi:uncharacterized phage protein (TIGR01671 family)
MSREIEFRAWHTRDNCFCNSLTLGQVSLIGIDIHSIYGGDIILMQYTGIKDKNGKKIFEGDIVKEIESEYTTYIGSVMFSGGSFRFEYRSGYYKQLSSKDIRQLHTSEIIGNIYENSELLEVKK